ncbi:MAG: dicarboxylate/amino acid:cation symporter, partial [Planctomycetota bacterium]
MKRLLHTLIFVGMVLGVVAGMALWHSDHASGFYQDAIWLADLLGKTVFIGLLKMIVAPLIFFSILAAIVSIANTVELWRIGWKTLAYYFATTSIAVGLGLFFVLTIQPGMRGDREQLRSTWGERRVEIEEHYGSKQEKVASAGEQSVADTIKQNLEKIIMNPFRALTEGQTLGVIFFASLLGIALIVIGKEGRPVIPVIEGVNAAIMKVTGWIMAGSPFFIFCLITSLVGQH